MLGRLRTYFQMHGHTLVPQMSTTERALGKWVSVQRKRLRSKTMYQSQFESLLELNFVWAADTARNPKPMVMDDGLVLLPPENTSWKKVPSQRANNGRAQRPSTVMPSNQRSKDESHAAKHSDSDAAVFALGDVRRSVFLHLFPWKLISKDEYRSLDALMDLFYRNPFVSEHFKLPFAQRHPVVSSERALMYCRK
jgi:hypothetical protein